jgi:hypothetical protein
VITRDYGIQIDEREERLARSKDQSKRGMEKMLEAKRT